MTRPAPRWSATVAVAARRAELARRLEQALAPEAAREVPRARTTIRRRGAKVVLEVRAEDAGALRAALNTYLGWVALSLAADRVARAARPAPRRSEVLISRAR